MQIIQFNLRPVIKINMGEYNTKKTDSFRKIHISMNPPSMKMRSTCLQADRMRAEIGRKKCMITSQPFSHLG